MTSLLDELDAPDCLVYGIGNVARRDDGLGWAFVDWLEESGLCRRTTLVHGYQLQLEDADLIAGYRRVLFVDATRDPTVDSYRLERPLPRSESSFTSHALTIPTVLAVAEHCFDARPDVTALAIRGHAWNLQHGLTARASHHLTAAITAVSACSPWTGLTEGRTA